MAIKPLQPATGLSSATDVELVTNPNGFPATPTETLVAGMIDAATWMGYARKSNAEDEKSVINCNRQHLRIADIFTGKGGPIRVPAQRTGREEPYTDDGISAAPDDDGGLKNRPGWEAFLVDILVYKPTYVAAIRTDRWARDTSQIDRLIRACRKVGAFLVTELKIYDPRDRHDRRRLMDEALTNRDYVEAVTEAIHGTLAKQRAMGIVTNPKDMLGVERIHDDDCAVSILRAAGAADAVKTLDTKCKCNRFRMERKGGLLCREVKDRFLARGEFADMRGGCLGAIARVFMERGQPTPRGGKRWDNKGVARLMTRAVNIGRIEHKGAIGAQIAGWEGETIYTEEEFYAILDKLGKNPGVGRPREPRKHMATGGLYCWGCMRLLGSGERQTNGAFAYRCRRGNDPIDPCPAPVLIVEEPLHEALRLHVCGLLADQEHVAHINAIADEHLVEWRDLLHQVEQKELEKQDVMRNSKLPAAIRGELATELLMEIDDLRRSMNLLAPDDPTGAYRELKAKASQQVFAEWDAADAEQQNTWWRTVVRGYVILPAPAKRTFGFDPSRIYPVDLGQPLPPPQSQALLQAATLLETA